MQMFEYISIVWTLYIHIYIHTLIRTYTSRVYLKNSFKNLINGILIKYQHILCLFFPLEVDASLLLSNKDKESQNQYV